MAKTIVKRCTCINDFQDRKYGRGNRVMNVCQEGKAARCSSCEMVHILRAADTEGARRCQ